MAFGLTTFKTTPAGIDTARVLRLRSAEVLAVARSGGAPIRVIAPDIEQHLGDNATNSMVGRLIREWLGSNFRVSGRAKWPREHGTESGSTYRQVA